MKPKNRFPLFTNINEIMCSENSPVEQRDRFNCVSKIKNQEQSSERVSEHNVQKWTLMRNSVEKLTQIHSVFAHSAFSSKRMFMPEKKRIKKTKDLHFKSLSLWRHYQAVWNHSNQVVMQGCCNPPIMSPRFLTKKDANWQINKSMGHSHQGR